MSNRIMERQRVEGVVDRDSGLLLQSLELRRCVFSGCGLSIASHPSLRTTVRDVRLINCETFGCSVGPASLENVVVDGLKTHGLFQVWAAALRHVVIKGKVERLMFSPKVRGGLAPPSTQAAFDKANAEYYAATDWALDIAEAEFSEAELQGIPARLIRRDPATQVVVTRERALAGTWRSLGLSKTHWATSIELFLEDGDQDVVLVAPKRHRKYLDLLDGLKMLRDAGVAQPD